jgi:uroporphyrinogen decarboxylase
MGAMNAAQQDASAARDSLLVRAATGRPGMRPPVWFMRQAGRSLPEYREVRKGTAMLDACRTPELITEITLQPVRRHGVDAAILFSDIVVPLVAAGLDIDIVAGTGPVVAHPVRTAADIAAIPTLEPDAVDFVQVAVGQLVRALDGVPLIGFAGAPFTLASYLVEGGPSRDYARTKALMYSEPELWHALLGRLARITGTFLRVQVDAGVSVVQLFDSWAGALSTVDYERFVLPHSTAALAAVDQLVPTIHFGVGTAHLLPLMRSAGADVVGVDWRTPLDRAAAMLRSQAPVDDARPVVVQGNLDPAILGADWSVVAPEVRRIVAQGRAADGHIFNLGHGVLPGTDPGVLTAVVDLVHGLGDALEPGDSGPGAE